MAVIIDKSLQEKLQQVRKREWWPVASLAKILKRPKSYIYRRIDNDDFDVFYDGRFKKISSDSVERYFTEKCI